MCEVYNFDVKYNIRHTVQEIIETKYFEIWVCRRINTNINIKDNQYDYLR